jgi:hypothetical protein
MRLTIDWLDAVCPRLDIAYLWKAMPTRYGAYKLREEEKEILKTHYPRTPRLELLKLLPDRTWNTIRDQAQAQAMQVWREMPTKDDLFQAICYRDLVPNLDGQYLFRDYATTLAYIKKADSHTSRSAAPLYALWLLSENVDELLGLIEQHLNGVG